MDNESPRAVFSPQWALGFFLAVGLLLFGSSLSRAAIPHTPTNWQWQAGADLTTPRMNHTAHLLSDGRVVVIGGVSDWSNVIRLNSAEVYDPATNTWSLYPNGSNSFRNQHTSTLLNDGRILVIGGDANFGGVVDSAEIFDPLAGTWTAVSSPGPMAQHTAVLLNDGSVLVFGGITTGNNVILHAMRYHVATDTWNYAGLPDLSEPTGERLHDGQVLAMARSGFGSKQYNPANDSWTPVGDPPTNWPSRWGVSLTRDNGNIYFAGYDEDVTYFASGGWSGVGTLAVNRNTHAATVVNGGVMLISGLDENYNQLTSVEVNGVVVGNLQTGRTWHTATTLNDGRVLVSGGLVPGPLVLNSVEIGAPVGGATATPTQTPTVTPTATMTPTPTATPRTDGVIGGRIWIDEGDWAVQDGEPGLANIEVRLYTNQGGNLVDDTTTDADGRYTFSNLPAAPGIVYTVYTYTPVRHAFVTANEGNDDTVDSDVDYSQPVDSDPLGIWVGSMTIPMDGTNLVQTHWDAGMHSNSMSGRIWWDYDSDGVQDGFEYGLMRIEVGIHDGQPPTNGSIIRTVITDENGDFTAFNLPPGNYWAGTVMGGILGEYNISPANQGNNDATDSEAILPTCYPAPNCPFYTPSITVPTNGEATRQDFGIIARAYFNLHAIEWRPNAIPSQGDMTIPLDVAMYWSQTAGGQLSNEQILPTQNVLGRLYIVGLARGMYRFVWSKPAGYLIRPQGFGLPTEPDPTTGSTGQIHIPVQSHKYGLLGVSEIFYYIPGVSGSATPGGGGDGEYGRGGAADCGWG